MNKEWFIFKGTQHLGPFSLEEVKEQYLKGEIKKETLIWKEGSEKWEPLSKTESFGFLFAKVEIVLPPLEFELPPVPSPLPPPQPKKVLEEDDLPPPIPLDAIIDPLGIGRQRAATEQRKTKFSKLFLFVGAIIFAMVVGRFVTNEQQSSIELHIKGLMPVYLEKLAMTATKNTSNFEAEIALSLDSSTLWATTNLPGNISTVIKLTSVPKKVLGTENITLIVKGEFINHVGKFNRMVLTEGSKFLPGEYNFHVEGRQTHFLNQKFKSLSGINFFKALNKTYSYDGTAVIYAGTPRELDKKLDEYQVTIMNELLKPFQDKLERIKTFESLLNATSQNFLMELDHLKFGKNISIFETKFIKEISPLLQSLVVKADELSKDPKLNTANATKDLISPYKEQIQIGKQIGEMASDMITHTQKFKKLSDQNKKELREEFDKRSRAIKTQIDQNLKSLEEEILKMSKP